MKKLILAITLPTILFASLSQADQDDLPIYYINGKQINSAGFFYNNLYLSAGIGISSWKGINNRYLYVNHNGVQTKQFFNSPNSSTSLNLSQEAGVQFNLSSKLGYRLGLTFNQGFYRNSSASVQQDNTKYNMPLNISSYSFILDNKLLFAAYQRNLFKLAPYINAGIGIAVNSANLQSDKLDIPKFNSQFVKIKFHPSTNVDLSYRLGTGIGFYFSPTNSFRYGQLLSIGYEMQVNGNAVMKHDDPSGTGFTASPEPIYLKIVNNTIQMEYSLTF